MSAPTLQTNSRAVAHQSKTWVFSLLDRLQRTLGTLPRSPKLILNQIRQIISGQQKLVRACVSAIRDVAKSRHIDVDTQDWQEFFNIAPECHTSEKQSAARKLRALALLTSSLGGNGSWWTPLSGPHGCRKIPRLNHTERR